MMDVDDDDNADIPHPIIAEINSTQQLDAEISVSSRKEIEQNCCRCSTT